MEMIQTKLISQIDKLRVRTELRGASPSEEETAAMIIGRILMRNSELAIQCNVATQPHRRQSRPSPSYEQTRCRTVAVMNCSVIAATGKAILCNIPGFGETWIPLSQTRDGNELIRKGDFGKLVVTAWIARLKGFAQ